MGLPHSETLWPSYTHFQRLSLLGSEPLHSGSWSALTGPAGPSHNPHSLRQTRFPHWFHSRFPMVVSGVSFHKAVGSQCSNPETVSAGASQEGLPAKEHLGFILSQSKCASVSSLSSWSCSMSQCPSLGCTTDLWALYCAKSTVHGLLFLGTPPRVQPAAPPEPPAPGVFTTLQGFLVPRGHCDTAGHHRNKGTVLGFHGQLLVVGAGSNRSG